MAETEMQEIVVDFGKICRLCLSEDGILICLYTTESNFESTVKTIPEKIMDLMSIQVTKDDGLPPWICHNCLSQVDKCCEFFEMCRSSQFTLKESYVKALSEAGVNVCTIKNIKTEDKSTNFPDNFKTNNSETFDDPDDLPELKLKQEFSSDEKQLKTEAVKNGTKAQTIALDNYFCNDCQKMFINKEEFLIHRVSVHHDDLVAEKVKVDETSNDPVTGLWTCDACGAKFRTKSAIMTHIRCKHLKSDKESTPYFRKHSLCKYCGSSYSRNNFTRHLEYVHRLTKNADFDQADMGSFDCSICFRPFVRHSSLRSHIEKCHADSLQSIAETENCEVVWSCSDCETFYSEEVYLIQHYGSKHSKYPMEVDSLKVLKSKDLICSCGVINSDPFDSSLHDVLYHYYETEETIECLACDKSFERLTDLKNHLVSYHWFIASSHENECVFCGEEFNTNDVLRLHMHEKHEIRFEKLPPEEKPPSKKKTDEITFEPETCEEKEEEIDTKDIVSIFVCDICNTYFDSGEELENHAKDCTAPHVCVLCKKEYKTENHLKRHVLEYHNTMSPIKCPLCPKVFPRKMNLHNHYKRRHLKQAKKFVCSYCGQSLKGKVALRSHEDRLHRNIRSYKCSECPEAFTTRSILRKHAQRHLADRPMLQCQYCERKFTTISGIERHVKTHEGVKEFECTIPLCGKSFYTKSELKRHYKFHNKDFRHVCPVCNHKFMTPGELKKHSTKHTGERPFKCHLCSCEYSRRDDKVKHLKRVHNLKVKRIYGKPLRKFSDDESEVVDNIVIDDGSTEDVQEQDDIVYSDLKLEES